METQYVPRPEWYYLPIFQWLKYFKGPLAIFGIVIIPTLTAALVVFLPFLDRRLERRPWKRPIAVGIFLTIFLTLITFGWLSGYEDGKDPAIAKQVAKPGGTEDSHARADKMENAKSLQKIAHYA